MSSSKKPRDASGETESESKWRARVTVIATMVSLTLSIAAFVLSYRANQEEAAVDLRAAASVNSLGSTPAGYAVRISFVNDSLRPIIISAMKLRVDGVPVATIPSVLSDNRAGADASSLGDEPLEDARSLPFALAARGAQTLTGLADFSLAERTKRRAGAREFCRELPGGLSSGVKSLDGRSPLASSVELEIDFDPGKTLKVPVQITNSVGVGNPWRMEVTGSRMHPTGVAFWRYTSAPSALRLLTLKVWKGDGELVQSGSLPVAGSATSEVQFPGLDQGYYRAAVFQNSDALAVGHFDVPLKKSMESIYPLGAQRANGQCQLIEGRKNVFTYPRREFEHP